MTARTIKAAEAFKLGLIDRVYPEDIFFEQVRGYAERIAMQPAQALALAKKT